MPYEIKIVRFGLYPAEEPTSYCVGFSGQTAAGRSIYQDTQVALEEARDKTEEEIVALAWEKVKDGFTAWMEDLAAKSSLLNKEWDPKTKKVKVKSEE